MTHKKSIYLTDQLELINNECTNGYRNRSFSGRVADIVDRYSVLISLTDTVSLSDNEKVIFGEAILGTFIDRDTITYLHENLKDTGLEGADELAAKVEPLSPLERMALIESLDL